MLSRLSIHRRGRGGASALLVAGLLSAGAAGAASYQFRQFIPGLTASPLPQAQAPMAALAVALAGGALPAGMVSRPYAYNLHQLLSVTGDTSYDASQVGWSVAAGELPPGLTLGSNGEIAGTPTTKNVAGSSFQVLASYKTKEGRQAYTLVVNGAVLQAGQVAVGRYHTCALTLAGGVMCWGRDTYGQLGNDSALASKSTPVAVPGLTSGVVSVFAGERHTCVLTGAGGVKCWGEDSFGQLGDGVLLSNQTAPVAVQGLDSGVVSISGGAYHTCAITTSGGLKCWGYDGQGQLGNDSSLTNKPTPVEVQGLTSEVAQVSGGIFHTCALTTAGAVKCWGEGGQGQLGDAAKTSSPVPVSVQGLSGGVADIAVGGMHSCARTQAGAALCWGADSSGQLGNDVTKMGQNAPVAVYGLSSGVTALAAGDNHTCAVVSPGGLKCWGNASYGQLGDGGATHQGTPVDVIGLSSGVTSVSAGGGTTCALVAGALKCWGANDYGQVGISSNTNQSVPVDVNP